MKRWVCFLGILIMLCGCSKENAGLQKAMTLRQKLQQAEDYSFTANITADYGDKTYNFSLACTADQNDAMAFRVLSPESISGVSGRVFSSGGELAFDDKALFFETLADGEITPVSGPWLVLRGLESGYIRGTSKVSSGYEILLNDSYREDAMQIQVQIDNQGIPLYGEIIWQGRRVLSIEVEDFQFL